MKLNRVPFLVLSVALIGSCANAPPAEYLQPADEVDLLRLYPPQASKTERPLEIAARVRLVLPKYRIKGTCGIYRYEDGSVQIDFIHSSFFGSYREDASILVHEDSMAIQDHERGVKWASGETLALVSEHFDFEFRPEDILALLLLGIPRHGDLCESVVKISEEKWSMTGEWRGRSIEIDGVEGRGPVRFRICAFDGTGCYEAKYSYRSDDRLAGYPEKIVYERMGSSERLSIFVESVIGSASVSLPSLIKNSIEWEQDVPAGVTD